MGAFAKRNWTPASILIVSKLVSSYGGDKRDRTADLMTASCYRFVISGDFEYNMSVLSAKSAGFRKTLPTASTRFRAHLGHNLGQFSAVGYSLQSRR